MTTVLLTGFEPFAGDPANPSGDAVRAVAASWSGPETLVTEVLPVTFAGAADRIRELIAAHAPDVVIATGLAGGRGAVGVERVAINLQDARIPDNAGAQPVDEPSVPGAPAAIFATLPVKAIAAAVRAAGIPAEVSHTAGTFVCNHVMYTALDAVPDGIRAGFIHVPWGTGQGPGGQPELPLADIVRALEIAVSVASTPGPDLARPAGALH
ncbi:pyroglutamyl-peptidase I [Microbacterium sp. W1N]|uniref:pyroglutamyl-peptidase I n=1 Tax=Microbacterium festucae TaxID=2977531 RepID=UPI0021C0B807|nr:pyroglutamyl-peptidase I [Microbacterium festucae]MCT9821571.1 pyroglutamyl-peptidase I [Microbacterium festucae]